MSVQNSKIFARMTKEMSDVATPVVAIILAAGASRRFGSDKRLYAIDGVNLLQRCLAKPLAMNIPALVVLRPSDRHSIKELLGHYSEDPNVELLFANDAEQGMGHSLACAAHYLNGNDHQQRRSCFREPVAALVLLADMPWIKLESIAKIMDAYSANKIVVPTCNSHWGHPILFSRRWFGDLAQLAGDRGAKSVLKTNGGALIELEVSDEGIFRDIDEPPSS